MFLEAESRTLEMLGATPDRAGEVVRAHFGAFAAAIGKPAAGYPLVSRVRQLESITADTLIDPGWLRGMCTVWSAGPGKTFFRSDFRHPRPMHAREAHFLRRLAECIAKEAGENGPDRELCLRFLEAQEINKVRISRELHDEAAQTLAYLRMQLEMLNVDRPGGALDVNAIPEMNDAADRTISCVRRLFPILIPEFRGAAACLPRSVSSRNALNRMQGFASRRKSAQFQSFPMRLLCLYIGSCRKRFKTESGTAMRKKSKSP